MEEETFPNEDELYVASALLLLSINPSPKMKSISEISYSPSPKIKSISEISQIDSLSYTMLISDSKFKSTNSSSSKMKSISEISLIDELSYTTPVPCSKSKSRDLSTVTFDDYDDDAWFGEAKSHARRKKMIRIINKLKAVRRRRSKSNCRKMNSGKAKNATSLTTSSTSASSCVSIDYSALSDISSREAANKGVVKERAECVTRKVKVFPSVPRKTKVICSPHMRRRAEAILKVLSCHGCASEVRIRQLLGDSPDTSKALRILLRLEEVKRTGAGGQKDPYVYLIR